MERRPVEQIYSGTTSERETTAGLLEGNPSKSFGSLQRHQTRAASEGGLGQKNAREARGKGARAPELQFQLRNASCAQSWRVGASDVAGRNVANARSDVATASESKKRECV